MSDALPAATPWRELNLRWVVLFVALVLARLGSIWALYYLPTPRGVGVAVLPWRFVPIAIVAELALLLLGAAALAGVSWRLGPRGRRLSALVLVLVGLHLLGCEIDVHLRRWMGLRLHGVFLHGALARVSDAGARAEATRFLAQDVPALAASVAAAGLPLVAFLLAPRRPVRVPRARWLGLVGLACLGGSIYLEPARRKWRLVAPFECGLSLDLGRALFELSPPTPADFEALALALGRAPSPGPFPLWRPVPDEAASLARFRGRPMGGRPDVIMIAIESLRGWTLDLRSPRARELAPNLTQLWQERGVAFVHGHSAGFPSGEGNMNLHLGLWSHPSRAIAAEHLSIATRSLPDILGEAGYARAWLAASDPSFDNLHALMARSYDLVRFVWSADDQLMAVAKDLYRQRPRDRPILLSIYTFSTHTPYALPGEVTPDDPDLAYARALAFTDRAIGGLVEAVRKAGQLDRTIFVITGDHGQPNAWQREHQDELGVPHVGHTWTGLLVAGPGIQGASVRDEAASHVDVPPTVLGRLGLEASHHFLGRDLLAEPGKSAIAFLQGGVLSVEGDAVLLGSLDGGAPTRFRYDPGPAALGPGYRHGEPLAVRPVDRERLRTLRAASRAYAWLLDHDRVMPRATGASGGVLP